jgi:uncharacterized membrane protein YfcA
MAAAIRDATLSQAQLVFFRMSHLQVLQFGTVILISAIAGVMNAIAGGGTLLTFPALVGLGISPIVANATSTVALWPGAVSSMWGYRAELSGARQWAIGFAVPSLVGGGIGAWLLLRTPPSRFAALVPWLVLVATALFVLQPYMMRAFQRRNTAPAFANADGDVVPIDPTATGHYPSLGVIFLQLIVGIYGGYFGAAVGIIVLAVLGFMGLTNIHRMNGLKNWGGLCMNAVAALAFAFTSLVRWPIALGMAIGSVSGGYLGSRVAQRTPQRYVRRTVVVIGFVGGLWLLMNSHSA